MALISGTIMQDPLRLEASIFSVFAQDRIRLEATRVSGAVWLRDPAPLESTWPFYPAHETAPEDGDVYRLERDNTLWVWYGKQWIGPFTDFDAAMMAARMLP